MVQPAPAKVIETCSHCGSNLIIPDDDGKHCLICGRPYMSHKDYGRIGGLKTVVRYGRDYMAEIGRRGGLAKRLATLSELRQQPAPEAKSNRNGGNRLPNRLSELKELWRLQQRSKSVINENGEAR